MGIEQLENKGFAFINTEKLNAGKRQVVVVGAARGGTSLVAGALHHLGVFTGDKSNTPVFEDVLLSEAFENNDLESAQDIIDRYNSKHDVWAWKRPAALNYLDKVEGVMPNPFYIFIFKDIFAIANRNSISMKADIGNGLRKALVDYEKIVDFVSTTDKPVMLVSAEKALQNKERFVGALAEMNSEVFDVSDNIDDAINFITPNPQGYLDATRITKASGTVDCITKDKISGWAKYQHKSASAEVELYVNGTLIQTIIANIYRADLVAANVSIDGKNGFIFDLRSIDIKDGALLEVKVKNEIVNLKNGEGYA